ncbi:MAG: ceramidase domain-containing protein [Elusimicrobia bacterium]|nr:ceramidase domain-containing protein [Elusimicrobiota bacterium]
MKQSYVCAAILLACLATGFWLEFSNIYWDGVQPASCMPDQCFCEELRLNGIRQRSNTWSNLGFIFIGSLILSRALSSQTSKRALPQNTLNSNPILTAAYGLTMVYIGISSGYFHASLTYAGQWLDNMSMYMLMVFIILYNLARSKAMPLKLFGPAYIGAVGAMGVILSLMDPARRIIFAALLALATIMEVKFYLEHRAQAWGRCLAAAVFAIISAYACWWLDIKKIACAPKTWLQGHALWHILGAASAGFLFLYYKSETPPAPR